MSSNQKVHSVSITHFRRNIKDLTKDTTRELVLTNRGEPTGVYVGIEAWHANQELLGLLSNPQALINSLSYHQAFVKSGEPIGISLEEFEDRLKNQERLDASSV